MKERAWLASGDIGQLLTYIRKQPSLRGRNRRLALFATQCALRLWPDDPTFRDRAAEIVGRLAGGEPLTDSEAEWLARCGTDRSRPESSGLLLWAARLTGHNQRWPVEESAKHLAWRIALHIGRGEMAVQCRILRDIFGNPFRPVSFSPEWRTDTVLTLARQMYESREFGAMPILADALQDAGCNEPAILDHCRDTSLAHVRGCWVTDLVLGKE